MESVAGVLTSAFFFTATEVGEQDECRGECFQRTGVRNAFLAFFLILPSLSFFSPYTTFKNIGTDLKTFPFPPANVHMDMEKLGPSAFLSVSDQLQLDWNLLIVPQAEITLKGWGWSGQQGVRVLGLKPYFVLFWGHLTSAYYDSSLHCFLGALSCTILVL